MVAKKVAQARKPKHSAPGAELAMTSPAHPLLSDYRESPLFVGSTEKAFQVLHAFDGPDRQMPLSMIAKRAGLDRSATQRLVFTLEALGYIARVHNTRDYALTPKVLQFGYNYIRGSELVRRASPYLLDVSRTVGETINLHQIDGIDIVYLVRFPGKHLINTDIMVGSRLPAVLTASGTAMLSRCASDLVEEILRHAVKPLTPQSIVDPNRLRKRIKQAKERGYAIIVNETVMGDISVASSVTDEHGRAVAGISISVPTARWTLERVESELVKHVQSAATSLSATTFAAYR
jgi:IclR family transcriptional regulator, pca regulon regulatory protein